MLLVNLFLVCLAIGLDAVDLKRVEQGDWVFNQKPSSVETSGSRSNRLTANLTTSYVFFAMYRNIVANETNKSYYWEFNCVQNCYSVGVLKDTYDPSGQMGAGGNADALFRVSSFFLKLFFGKWMCL